MGACLRTVKEEKCKSTYDLKYCTVLYFNEYLKKEEILNNKGMCE